MDEELKRREVHCNKEELEKAREYLEKEMLEKQKEAFSETWYVILRTVLGAVGDDYVMHELKNLEGYFEEKGQDKNVWWFDVK